MMSNKGAPVEGAGDAWNVQVFGPLLIHKSCG